MHELSIWLKHFYLVSLSQVHNNNTHRLLKSFDNECSSSMNAAAQSSFETKVQLIRRTSESL